MRFPRYVLVGGVCALINNVIVIGCDRIGIHYIVSSCLGFVPVLCVGFMLHTSFTFRTSATWPAFVRYTLSMAANYPMWIGGLFVFCDLLGVAVAIAAPLITVLLFLWNFLSAGWALGALPGQVRRSVDNPQQRG